MATANRPLSPHLQVYKPQLTSSLSILHRGSGVFLSIGTLVLLYWLLALAAGPEAYVQAQSCLGSWYGQLALFGWTLAFYYHFCNGIRHLCWDAGYGFDIEVAYKSGYAVVAGAVGLTLITWIIILTCGGPA